MKKRSLTFFIWYKLQSVIVVAILRCIMKRNVLIFFFRGSLLYFNILPYFCDVGQNHCWLNTVNGTWRNLNEEGIYLVLLYQSCGTLNSNDKYPIAFGRLKHLQQRYNSQGVHYIWLQSWTFLISAHFRYPRLNVFALQHGGDISSLASQCQAFRTIAKEYITFPILMSDKDFSNVRLRPYPFTYSVICILFWLCIFPFTFLVCLLTLHRGFRDLCCSCFMHFSYHMKYYVKTRNVVLMSVQMTNGACYLLFEGSKDPVLFTNWVEEPDVMIKGKILTTLAVLLML